MNNEKDLLYEQVKEDITHGHRVPYRQYLRERTAYYIEKIANDDEIENIVNTIKNRSNSSGPTTDNDIVHT